jgi:hypothetical protein
VPASIQFSAQAGRTVGGFGGGSYCECGCPGPPACYADGTLDLCSTAPGSEPGPNCGGSSLTAAPGGGSQSSVDYGSIGLLLLLSGYLIRRII